jgi:DNA-binding Lrp family transcriptional regulator
MDSRKERRNQPSNDPSHEKGRAAEELAPASEGGLDRADRRLLNRIQSDFPITARPFQVLAEELGMTEREVMDRLARLRREGMVRRIGGNFVPRKVGFVSTLCAARVPEDRLEAFAEAVNRHPGVTHNYTRDSDYNVWFTFIAPSREAIAQNLAAIARETGVADILNLPATHVFKIRAQFKM